MTLFREFLEETLEDKSIVDKINAITLRIGETFYAFHYCKNIVQVGDNEPVVTVYINQVDEWSSQQPSVINNFEDIIIAIVKQEELEHSDTKIEDIYFIAVTRKGIYQGDFDDRLLTEIFIRPKVLFEFHQMKVCNWETKDMIFVHGNNDEIAIANVSLYPSLGACEKDFDMVKRFVNTIQNKLEEKRKTVNDDVFKHAGVKEATYYNWKKSKPKLVKTIVDGYMFSSLQNTVLNLARVPSLMDRTWGTDDVMKELDGSNM